MKFETVSAIVGIIILLIIIVILISLYVNSKQHEYDPISQEVIDARNLAERERQAKLAKTIEFNRLHAGKSYVRISKGHYEWV